MRLLLLLAATASALAPARLDIEPAARRRAQLAHLVAAGVFTAAQQRAFLAQQPQFLRLAFGVLHEDAHFLVVNKPFDVRLDLGRDGARRFAEEITCADWLAAPPRAHAPIRFCHQLDAATSGALVTAKTRAGAASARRVFDARGAVKRYRALVFGHVADDAFAVSAPLAPDPQSRFAQRVDRARGKPAETRAAVLARGAFALDGPHRGAAVSLLALEPVTGRRHQLRVHCAHAGHPIVGDTAYAGDWHSYRLFLHAEAIKLAPLLAPTGALDVTAPCADLDEAIDVVDGHSDGS